MPSSAVKHEIVGSGKTAPDLPGRYSPGLRPCLDTEMHGPMAAVINPAVSDKM